MHIDFFLLLLLLTKLHVSIRRSNPLLLPVLGTFFVSLGLNDYSLIDLNLLSHLLVESSLDSMQVEVDVLSEASRE